MKTQYIEYFHVAFYYLFTLMRKMDVGSNEKWEQLIYKQI